MSSMTLGPPFVIDGPVPVAPRFGLLAAAQVLPPAGDEHWMVGATMRAYSSDLPDVWAPCYEGSIADVKDDGGPTLQPTFGPWTVYLPATCNTWSARPDDEFRARLTVAFEAKEGWAVEREIATGLRQPLNPFFCDMNCVPLNGGAAVGPTEAMALLENAIAATAQNGLIHADPATVTSWAALDLVSPDGQVMRTAIGTPVAVGGGYIGATPEGEAAAGADQGWAFATGPVQVRRSNIEIPGTQTENIDRTINEVTIRAERHYLATWDTALQTAVLVDRSE